MTKEEAKEFGLNILHGVLARNEKFDPSYASLVKEAIEALTEPSHLSNLDEVAIDNAAKEYAFNNSDDSQEYMNGYLGFKAGVEWDREQMMKEAVKGVICKDEYRETAPFYYVESELFNLQHNMITGDKVRIIILKED